MNFAFQYAPQGTQQESCWLTSEYRLAGICSRQHAIQEYLRKVAFVIAKAASFFVYRPCTFRTRGMTSSMRVFNGTIRSAETEHLLIAHRLMAGSTDK